MKTKKILLILLAIISIALIVFGVYSNLFLACVSNGYEMFCEGRGATYILAGIILLIITSHKLP